MEVLRNTVTNKQISPWLWGVRAGEAGSRQITSQHDWINDLGQSSRGGFLTAKVKS